MKQHSMTVNGMKFAIKYHCDYGQDASIVLSGSEHRFTYCATEQGVRLLESDQTLDQEVLTEIAKEIREIELKYSKYTMGLVQFCYVTRVS